MPRGPLISFAIVAAFSLHPAAAAPVVEDAPIAPAVAEIVERLGFDPARDPSRFMTDVARVLYASPDSRPPLLGMSSLTAADAPGAVRVPVPLPAAVWSRAVFRRAVTTDQLISTILADRRAALLARGLSGLDDESLQYLIDHPALITFLYERAATTFAAFGDAFVVRDGRVVPVGGTAAGPLWESVVREPLSAPDRFARVLFGEYNGRLAYLYDVIGAADPRATAFALGLWIEDRTLRAQRFRALAAACITAFREWHPEDHPFARPLGDFAALLLRIRLQPSGAPAAPAQRTLWADVFDMDATTSGVADTALVGGPHGPVDAAWLLNAIGGLDMYGRIDRLDAFAFAQRVFAGSDEVAQREAVEVLRSFRVYRMLLLTLERVGVRAPGVYALALQRADAVSDGDSNRKFWTIAQFQGAIALLARLHRAGTLTTAAVSTLLASLCAVPLQESEEYRAGIATWVRTQLGPVLPNGEGWDARLIAALAGPAESASTPRLIWEGQSYRLDLVAAERQRLDLVRRKQAGPTIELALAIDRISRTLKAPSLSLDAVHAAADAARETALASAAQLRHPAVILQPPGVPLPKDAFEWLTSTAEDLARIRRPADLKRASRLGDSLAALVDMVLGNALLSLVYASDIGDPDGVALLAGNVALRHDFGLGRRDAEGRARLLWALPRQDFQPGVPWHIAGSLLGLDVALAPLNLRRLTLDRIVDAPKLPSIEREAFAVNVMLMESSRLTDQDRDAIATAIGSGRDRIRAIQAGREPLDDLAVRLGFDGFRRRALNWIMRNQPQNFAAEFSLAELVELGGIDAADLDAWGAPVLHINGCLCVRFPNPRAWHLLEGRSQLPLMAATMGDLSLAVAVMLRDLQLPAKLARPVLAVAMQEYVDGLVMTHSNDWRSLSRHAQALKRQSVEDYVAVAAAVNGPLVPDDSEALSTSVRP